MTWAYLPHDPGLPPSARADLSPRPVLVGQVLADGRELPLYGAGGFKFIWNPKFDAAMVAFLECLQELQVSRQSRKLRSSASCRCTALTWSLLFLLLC